MKKSLFAFAVILAGNSGFSQAGKTDENNDQATLLKEMSEGVCHCIDSIPTYDRRKKAIANDIRSCIDDKASAYQMGAKLMSIDKNNKQDVTISIDVDKDSKEYKKYYYDMERYLMDNCPAMKAKMAQNNQVNDKSISANPKALDKYNEGLDKTKKDDFKGAIECYKQAVKIDPEFAYAYDNMGICYRRLNEYDKAIDAYRQSLKIDPNGTMPLQNIAIAYQYKKEYQNAIDAYMRLSELDSSDPEIFYGIGQIYALYLNEYEKGLDYLCKAYNIYVEHSSPYRADAEKIINIVYGEMKKQGKEGRFNEILKSNNINPN